MEPINLIAYLNVIIDKLNSKSSNSTNENLYMPSLPELGLLSPKQAASALIEGKYETHPVNHGPEYQLPLFSEPEHQQLALSPFCSGSLEHTTNH